MFISRGLVKNIRIYSNIVIAHKGGYTMEIFMYLCRKLSNKNQNAIKVQCLWYGPVYIYKNMGV